MLLTELIAALKKDQGDPPDPPTRDPFEMVLRVNVAYLASDERREEAFEALRADIGTDPASIAAATAGDLERITARGILKSTFAAKISECARIALEEFPGGLDAVVRGDPAAAKRALRKFPGIGEPGAEKILLIAAGRLFLAPDSNALRVLVRTGIVADQGAYARTYRAAREEASASGLGAEELLSAHSLLRRHGQQVCRAKAPACAACPVCATCEFAAA